MKRPFFLLTLLTFCAFSVCASAGPPINYISTTRNVTLDIFAGFYPGWDPPVEETREKESTLIGQWVGDVDTDFTLSLYSSSVDVFAVESQASLIAESFIEARGIGSFTGTSQSANYPGGAYLIAGLFNIGTSNGLSVEFSTNANVDIYYDVNFTATVFGYSYAWVELAELYPYPPYIGPVVFRKDINSNSNTVGSPSGILLKDRRYILRAAAQAQPVCLPTVPGNCHRQAQHDWRLNFRVSETPLGPDTDQDGVIDTVDNCPFVANTDQRNTDNAPDGGDACDTDDDNDNWEDFYDNCPLHANPQQEDIDGDGIGNVCDQPSGCGG